MRPSQYAAVASFASASNRRVAMVLAAGYRRASKCAMTESIAADPAGFSTALDADARARDADACESAVDIGARSAAPNSRTALHARRSDEPAADSSNRTAITGYPR